MTNSIGTSPNPVRNTRPLPAAANQRARPYHRAGQSVTFGIWRKPEAAREAFVANQRARALSHGRPLNSPALLSLSLHSTTLSVPSRQLTSCFLVSNHCLPGRMTERSIRYLILLQSLAQF